MTSSRIALSLLVGVVVMLPAVGRSATGQWSPIGPEGGSVIDVVTDGTTVTTYAVTPAGLYRSTDGGVGWTLLGPDLFLRSPGLSKANPSVIYAAGTSGASVGPQDGLYRSVDAGSTWTTLRTWVPYATSVSSIAVDPTDASIVYAAMAAEGLLKSVDGGLTWFHSDAGLPGACCVFDVVVDPTTPSTLFVASSGIFKSTDAGATWLESDSGLPVGSFGNLTIDPQHPSTIYLQGAALYRSTDGGVSWTPTPNAGFPGTAPTTALAIDPSTSVLYASQLWSGLGAVYRSVDGGDSWSPTGCVGFAAMALAVQSDGVLFVAGDVNISFPLQGGVYRSTDGAASCAMSSHGVSAFTVAASAAAGGTVYLGDWRAGSFRSGDGGLTWSSAHGGLSGIDLLVQDLVVDPAAPSTVYQLTGNGNDRVWKSVDGGTTSIVVRGQPLDYDSLAIDPTDADAVFVGSRYINFPPFPAIPSAVERTTDGGATWARSNLSTMLVSDLAVVPGAPPTVYAGTDVGVLKSVDGGATFVQIGIGIPAGQPVIGLAVDPTDAAVVYALAMDFRSANPGGVFKSVDGAATFVPHNVGIEGFYSHAIALDPASPSTLYLTTDSDGVFRSTNGAATWSAVNEGLTNRITSTIVVDQTVPGRVYVGTPGSSMFVRDFPPPCPAGSDGDPCDDGDPCTLGDTCASGTCQGTVPACGDGVVAGCEQCDDGATNGTSASCCSATCTRQPAGTPCADDADLCTGDRCDAGGACTHPIAPDPLCVTPSTRGASLKIVARPGTGIDQVAFKWAKGPAIAKADFGAPNAGTSYALCVYDRAPGGDVAAYRGRALPPCNASPCWTDVSSGWKLRSTGGLDGIRSVVLKSGAAGRGSLQVKGKGASLALTMLPLAKSPSVVAQIRTSAGACWGATFSSELRNTAERFTARSD